MSSTGTGGGGGEYPLQDGFGWTNGVTLKMLDLICPQEKPCDALPATRPVTTPSPQDKPVAAPAANDPAPAEPQRPAPDASPPLPKSVGGSGLPGHYRPAQTHSAARGKHIPTPRVEQVTFSLDRTNTNNNNSHYFLTNNDRFVFHAAAYRSTRPRWFRMIL